MPLNIALGCFLMLVTTFVHAGGMVAAFEILKLTHAKHWAYESSWTKPACVGALVLLMFLASLIAAAIWAVTYMAVGAVEEFETALYFSTVTFTTLGYGDIVVHDSWRLLSSFQAATGIIVFGWTTALIFAVVQRLHFASQNNESS